MLRLKKGWMPGVMLVALVVVVGACGDGNKAGTAVDDYDRATMIANYTDNYIVPGYADFAAKTSEMDAAVQAFVASPTLAGLEQMRTKWEVALLVWQDIAFLEFGPAGQRALRSQTNLFPVNKTEIEQNIASGSYNLATVANYDAKGFQAIDYLIYGSGAEAEAVVTYFVANKGARDYLVAISADVKRIAQEVNDEWKGGYAEQFKKNTADNAQGSAVHELVNAINLHYETYIRKGKIGLPAGVFNGFSQAPMPDHVEVYYYGRSLRFAFRGLKAIHGFLNGLPYGSTDNKEGIDDYLKHVKATSNGETLSAAIDKQVAAIEAAMAQLNDPLKQEVVDNNTAVRKAYEEMQKLVPTLKVEMTNALKTTITYQDNDGD